MAFTFLIFLGIGFLIGSLRKWSERVIKWNQKLQTLGVIILIFVMGLSIGMDHSLVSEFSQLGIKSFLFAFFSVAGSILCVFLISKTIRRR